MKRLAALIATLATLTSVAPAQAFVIDSGDGPAYTQCQYIQARYPNKAANASIGCKIQTTNTFAIGANGMSSPKGVVNPMYTVGVAENDDTTCVWPPKYPTFTTCVGWQSRGDFDTWVLKLGAFVHYNFRNSYEWNIAYANPSGPNFASTCTIASAWGLTVSIQRCGLLWQTSTQISIGAEFVSTTPAFGPIPSAQVTWYAYVLCKKGPYMGCTLGTTTHA